MRDTKTAQEHFQELVRQNVEAIAKLEQATHAQRTRADVFADAIAQFCGSMSFVYMHVVLLGSWVLWNWIVAPPQFRFDPPPFTAMNTTLAVEAIFLTTFVLISQNRQQRIADRRNLLDLQINMLAEQENSQMLTMLQQLLEHHGLGQGAPEVQALQQATDPEALVTQIEEQMDPLDQQPEG